MPKVLIAEDDATMVSLLKTLLKMEGFDVVAIDVTANIPDAVRSEKPDVLLLDVHLSRQNGLQILDEIRKSTDLKDVKVAMSSGANVKEECIKHGANGFLLKPYMPDDLVGLLKRLVN